MPGALKNAVDWASRPTFGGPSAWKDKAVGIAGIGPQAYEGAHGGLLAAMALRQSTMYLEWKVIESTKLHISRAPDRFTESGELKQEVFFYQSCGWANDTGDVCVADDPRYDSRSDSRCKAFLEEIWGFRCLDSWHVFWDFYFRSSSS